MISIFSYPPPPPSSVCVVGGGGERSSRARSHHPDVPCAASSGLSVSKFVLVDAGGKRWMKSAMKSKQAAGAGAR